MAQVCLGIVSMPVASIKGCFTYQNHLQSLGPQLFDLLVCPAGQNAFAFGIFIHFFVAGFLDATHLAVDLKMVVQCVCTVSVGQLIPLTTPEVIGSWL